MNMKTIVLIGMMGAGKSQTGKNLASKISCKYFDLDKTIELKENMTISDIFARYGEKYFRTCEYKTLKQIFEAEDMVISLGGGTFENDEIRNLVLKSANVVYLETSASIIYERIKNDTSRPLLKNNMTIEAIEKLINIRKNNYKLAPYTILTDNITIEDVTSEIMKCVGLK